METNINPEQSNEQGTGRGVNVALKPHSCEHCYRFVRPTHPDCGGDPRATCSIYGCGDRIVQWGTIETHGDGRTARLGYCADHINDGNAR